MDRWTIPFEDFIPRLKRAFASQNDSEIRRCMDGFLIGNDGVIPSASRAGRQSYLEQLQHELEEDREVHRIFGRRAIRVLGLVESEVSRPIGS
jgi:hypothetical protein